MGVALGLIAIALAGAAGEPKSKGDDGQIHYTVRFIETEGMGWRTAVFTRLTPVTRQGAATVWTAPAIVKQRLLQQALKGQGARSVQTPVIKGWTGSAVHFSIRDNRRFVTQVAWDGDDRPAEGKSETVRTGPVGTMAGRKLDQGVLVQLVLEDTEIRAVHRVPVGGSAEPKASPEIKKTSHHLEAPPYLSIPVWGGPVPSGTISEVRFDGNKSIPEDLIRAQLFCKPGQMIDPQWIDTDVAKLMGTKWFSDVRPSYAPFPGGKNILYFNVHETPGALAYRAALTHNQGVGKAKSTVSSDSACETGDLIKAHLETTRAGSGTKADEVIPASIEVPEIASQEIAGEWLIPKDGILLVSFGPHTVAGKDGKAVIRERLAMIEAEGFDDGTVQQSSLTTGRFTSPNHMTPSPTTRPRPVPAPIGGGEAPQSFPALPSRSLPQGVHADGSPAELPPLPADDAEDSSSSDSAEPRPSPQSRKPQEPPKATPSADSHLNRTGFDWTSMLPSIPSLFQAANQTVDFQFLVPIKVVSLKLPFNRKLEIEIFGRVVPDPETVEVHSEVATKPRTSKTR